MKFYKYHGVGNDYIVIDSNEIAKLSKKQISLICNRNKGIGSDGLLLGPFEDNLVKIYNSDGSEAEKSGNGIRIFSKYIQEKYKIKDKETIIKTKSGDVEVKYLEDSIKLNMGKYTFVSNEIPTKFEEKEILNKKIMIKNQPFNINCVNIGNPHCVIISDDLDVNFVKKYGPLIEKSNFFPSKINVQFVKITDKNNIIIEIWERGSGYTLSSGTSSCAAVLVANKLGLVEEEVIVHMPGGTLKITIKNKEVYLEGKIEKVFEGNFSKEFAKTLKLK